MKLNTIGLQVYGLQTFLMNASQIEHIQLNEVSFLCLDHVSSFYFQISNDLKYVANCTHYSIY